MDSGNSDNDLEQSLNDQEEDQAESLEEGDLIEALGDRENKEQRQKVADENNVLMPYNNQSRCSVLSDLYKFVQPSSPIMLAIWSGANYYATLDQFLRAWKEHEDTSPYATIPGPFFFAAGLGFGIHAMNNPDNDNSTASLFRRIWITCNEAGAVVLLWLIGEGIQIYLISCERNAQDECNSSDSLFWELFFAPAMGVASVYMMWELIPFQWKEKWIIPDSHKPSWKDYFKRWGTFFTETILKTLFYSRIFERLMQVAFCNDAEQRSCTIAAPLTYELAAVPAGLVVVSSLYLIRRRDYREIPRSFLFYLNTALQSQAFLLHAKDELNSKITLWPAIVKMSACGLSVAGGGGFIVYQYLRLKKEDKEIQVVRGPEHEWFQRQTEREFTEAVNRRMRAIGRVDSAELYEVPLDDGNNNTGAEENNREVQNETRRISVSSSRDVSNAGDFHTPLTPAYNSRIKHETDLRRLEEANSQPVEAKPSRKRWFCKDMCVIS